MAEVNGSIPIDRTAGMVEPPQGNFDKIGEDRY